MGKKSAGVRHRRARFAVIAALAAIGWLLLGGPVLAATAAVDDEDQIAVVADPLECSAMLDPAIIAEVEARGYVQTDRQNEFGTGGRACWWGIPDSRFEYFGVGYSYATPADVDALIARLVTPEAVFGVTDTGDDGIVIRAIPREFTNMAELADLTWQYHYTNGLLFWVVDPGANLEEGVEEVAARYQASDALIADLEANVLGALLPVVAEPDPEPADVVVDPLPAPVITGFDASTPSFLSALTPVGEIDATPASVVATVATASVLVALVALPGRLLDSAITGRYDQWRGFLAPALVPFRGAGRAVRSVRARVARLPRWVPLTVGIAAASVLTAMIAPEFGLNGGTVRVVLTLAAAIVIENVIGWTLIGAWMARRGIRGVLRFRLGALAVVLASVIASRLSGFEPGFVFGIVLALVFATHLPPDREKQQALAEIGWLFVLGLLSWLIYSALTALRVEGVWGVSAIELFSGLAVGCLMALALMVLPLRGLPGLVILKASKPLFAGVAVVGVAVFVFVVIGIPDSWEEVGAPLATWVLLFVVYAALALALWAIISFVPDGWLDRDDAESASPQELIGDSADR